MADEHVGEAVLLAEVCKKVEHLALNGNVKRGDRLIEHDKLGVEGERSRDSYALSLSTGEFVWVTDRILRRESDQLKRLVHALAALRGASDVVRQEPLFDLVANWKARVQGSERVLEDDLHAATELAALFGAAI